TAAPSRAKSFAHASPIPLLAPVTSTRLPRKSNISARLGFGLQVRERRATRARVGDVRFVIDALALRADARVRLVGDHFVARGAVFPDDLNRLDREHLARFRERLRQLRVLRHLHYARHAHTRLAHDPSGRLRLRLEERADGELRAVLVAPDDLHGRFVEHDLVDAPPRDAPDAAALDRHAAVADADRGLAARAEPDRAG